jgi:serine/threonine protein kinase/tetratricopeptide (TPR) repeat protein
MNTDLNPANQADPRDESIPPATEPYQSPSEGVGTKIGGYKLLQKVGEGGFGIVYLAEQDRPVQRRVALKLIKPGMDSAQVIARFEAERQALAMMDNQNIAKVFDAGNTETGRPFFVMEMVHGVPITRYCDDSHLGIRERLKLFVPVCKAVQHAHQKGIIHRDLKPSNVLVCLQDGEPLPKVIDFGVAKAVEQRLGEHTIFTQYGQIVGTLEYMSPEQAEMSQLGVDTRSDIYSLGVILYELLTGSTPLERRRLRQAGLNEMLRIIKEEDPAKPSARLAMTDKLTAIAARRNTESARLQKMVKGELDWIVMKCLEKDRARRYETANGLVRDLQRYLSDEPVEACPPSAGYRLSKLARKYRTALNIAALMVLFLVIAAAVSTWQAVRATRERDRAEASFRMARDTVDRFFMEVGDNPKLRAQGMEKFRKDMLQNAKEFYERFIQNQFDAPEVRHDLGLAHYRLAKLHEVLGDYDAAEALSEKAIGLLGELSRAHPEVAGYQRDLAASKFGLGAVYFDTGRLEKAETAYLQAMAIQERLAIDHAEATEFRRALAMSQSALGLLYYRTGRLEKAQASQELALATWSKLVANEIYAPEDQQGLATVQERLGETYRAKGWTEKAEQVLKGAEGNFEALVHEHPDVPEYQQARGRTYIALGRLYHSNVGQAEKAETAHQRAMEIFEKLAQRHPDVPEYSFEVGRTYRFLGLDAQLADRKNVAVTRYEKAISVLESVLARGYREGRSELFNARITRAMMLAEIGERTRATSEVDAVASQEGLSEVNLYNIACFFSQGSAQADKDTKLSPADRSRLKTHYANRALEFLRQAIAKGYENLAVLKTDKDLDSLRSRQDFNKLVQDVEQKNKK